MEWKILLTDHAKESINKRIGCAEGKQMKLVTKAWKSKEFAKDNEIANKKFYSEKYAKEEKVYKKLMGLVYVFTITSDRTALLVTVYSPVIKLIRAPKPFFTEHN